MKPGRNLSDLLNENKSQILRYLIHHKGISRIDLSTAVGLKPASITKIVQQLLDQGLIIETGFSDGAKGRRSISLSFNYSHYYILAIKLNWNRLKIDLLDFQGISQKEEFSMSFDMLTINHMDNIIDLIAEKANSIIEKYSNIIAVGVSSFGPYSYSNGSIVFMDQKTNAPKSYPFKQTLQRKLPLPVFVELDAIAGALSYWWFRFNCDLSQRLMHIFAGEGIGGGFVINGQPLSHFLGNAFEFGHIIIDMNGEQCKYGCTGCLETFCDLPSFLNHIREVLPAHPDSLLTTQKDTFTIYDLLDATHMGDAFAISMLEDWGRYLGCGIASILPLFSPDIIIISDIMVGGGQCLLEAIEHSMHFYQHCCYRSPKLIFADPQDDLVLLGAATVAIDKVLSDPNRYFPSGSEP